MTGAAAGDDQGAARIAYCAPGMVRVSNDGGTTWTDVPVDTAVAAAEAAGFPLLPEDPGPTCTSVALDPVHPGALYAVFRAGRAPDGAPPVYLVGFVRAEGSDEWQPVALQGDDDSLARFGGFRVQAESVAALFAAPEPVGEPGDGPDVWSTADGGRTWERSAPECSGQGPCVAFGPSPTGIGSCAMHAYPQAVQYQDPQAGWQEPAAPPGDVNACLEAELVLRPPTEALLVGTSMEGPVAFVTADGGRTWSRRDLSPLPDADAQPAARLLALPGGSLLAAVIAAPTRWYLLPPEASDWCPIRQGLPADPWRLTAAAGRLWWLEPEGTGGGGLRPGSLPLEELRCGEG